MRYDKQLIKKDGRKLTRSGPRDMQSRFSSQGMVDFLTDQVASLKAEILDLKKAGATTTTPTGYMSPEQVDEEIRKAVDSAVSDVLKSKDGNVIAEERLKSDKLRTKAEKLAHTNKLLTNENMTLKERLVDLGDQVTELSEYKQKALDLEKEVAHQKELVEVLKTKPAIITTDVAESVAPDRPQMEQVFVDPLDGDAEKGLKPTISVDTILKEETVDDKVDRLRDLVGKLPG